MKRLILWLLVLTAAAALASCGNKEKHEPEVAQKGESPQRVGPISNEAPDRPGGKIQGPAMDRLRLLKKEFGLTRDQYWKDEGGVLANEFFEVWYPVGWSTVTHGMYVFELFMPARDIVKSLFGKAPDELLVVHVPADLEAYKELTGREWWCYSEIRGDTLTFGPVEVLFRRGISHLAVPHEYYQWAIGKITHHAAPRWLEEGIASYLVGEEGLLVNQAREFQRGDITMTPEKIEEVLEGEQDRRESRIAYFRAYFMVKKLVDTYGEETLGEAVRLMGTGHTLDEAFMATFNKDYNGILEIATDYTVDLTRKSE